MIKPLDDLRCLLSFRVRCQLLTRDAGLGWKASLSDRSPLPDSESVHCWRPGSASVVLAALLWPFPPRHLPPPEGQASVQPSGASQGVRGASHRAAPAARPSCAAVVAIGQSVTRASRKRRDAGRGQRIAIAMSAQGPPLHGGEQNLQRIAVTHQQDGFPLGLGF